MPCFAIIKQVAMKSYLVLPRHEYKSLFLKTQSKTLNTHMTKTTLIDTKHVKEIVKCEKKEEVKRLFYERGRSSNSKC